MRRASTFAASSAAAVVFQYRLSQASFYRTSTATSSAPSRWFPTASNEGSVKFASLGLVGALSVVGAASLLQEAYAKEPVSADRLPKDVVLYQYEPCPFCNKVKAFLDYYDVPYKVVEVNPLSKKEIKWSKYKKVPILVVDGEQMVDSSAIIDKFSEKVSLKESTKAVTDNDEEKKWRQWVDNHLVHVLSPNIYRNVSEALESFDYFTSNDNYSLYEKYKVKYGGAAVMYFVSKQLKTKYNITDERKSLYEAAETWVDALDGRDFLGGSKPNLADLAVYGVLRPIRYLRSGKDMVEHTRIGEWYGRMEQEVGESTRIKSA